MTMLRPRQKIYVDRCYDAIKAHGNTLGVAPTGFGKTISLSALAARLMGVAGKVAIFQHRDKLVEQNVNKFRRVNPGISTSVVDGKVKNWSGNAVFAMAPTVARMKNLINMPALDALIIDEGHRAPAQSYQDIIGHAREVNPDCAVCLQTATAQRGDKKSLRQTVDNVGDQVMIGELIASGHLVPPVTYAIDIGVTNDLRGVPRKGVESDPDEVARILNHPSITKEVIRHWGEKAPGRKTTIFCSNVQHAKDVHAAFVEGGFRAGLIYDGMPSNHANDLARYEAGALDVMINCMMLIEGWDDQPTSCIMLLVLNAHEGRMIQMIGRGLRTVDPEIYPGVIKTDCVVLDFGLSTTIHGSLEQSAKAALINREKGEAPIKICPSCESEIPIFSSECQICGFTYPNKRDGGLEGGNLAIDHGELGNLVLTEIDLLNRSNFKWIDLFNNEKSLVASGMDSWAGVFRYQGNWYSIGGAKIDGRRQTNILSVGDRMVGIARGDDWLSEHETDKAAHKTKRWMRQEATPNQLKMLGRSLLDMSLDRYKASCLISYGFNEGRIRDHIYSHAGQRAA